MNKIKQIGALILVLILIGLVLLTLFLAVTGSSYFMASLITTLMLPILLYAYMFIYRLLRKEDKSIKKEKNFENRK